MVKQKRSNTISSGGNVEYERIRAANQLVMLQQKLEKKAAALKETEHELHIAATIGQGLLKKIHQCEIESEKTVNKLNEREEEIAALHKAIDESRKSYNLLGKKYSNACYENEVLTNDLSKTNADLANTKGKLQDALRLNKSTTRANLELNAKLNVIHNQKNFALKENSMLRKCRLNNEANNLEIILHEKLEISAEKSNQTALTTTKQSPTPEIDDDEFQVQQSIVNPKLMCKNCLEKENSKEVDKITEAVDLLQQVLPHSLMDLATVGLDSVLSGSITILRYFKKKT